VVDMMGRVVDMTVGGISFIVISPLSN